MQISRLFEIVYLLLNQKNITAGQLAEHFEVSQRTIYRDIEALCQSGIPVCTSKGRGGGVSLPDNFILNKSVLSEREQNEILSALQGMRAANYQDSEQILSKLNALFGGKNANWIEVDFSDWSNTRKEMFAKIKTAILEKRVLHFEYYGSSSEKTVRSVEPLKLYFKEKAWYLIAFCRTRQDLRTFKVMRIKNLQILSEYFERNFIQNEKSTSMQTPSKIVELKLWIDASQAYRVYDEFEEEQVVRNKDGSFTISVSYPEDDWVYGYILSFGCYAKVFEPIHIRDIVKERLEKTLKLYS